MPLTFAFESHIPRTVFGSGNLTKIPEEIARLNLKRVLLVTEDNDRATALAAKIKGIIGEPVVGVCTRAVMHTPEPVTFEAIKDFETAKADGVVSIGGGSCIGLGKALCIRKGVPHIAVPTTYAGSEATPVLGETVDGLKTTRTDPRILPNTIVYDVDLTLTLPRQLTWTSGINAIAHAVEGLYSTTINPIIEGVALSGITFLFNAFKVLNQKSDDMDARSQALSGAWACAVCLGHVGMGLHHKLCHTLGGSFGLPHSETHTVILPHAMAYNQEAAASVMEKIRHAINAPEGVSAAQAVWDLEKSLGTVQSLKDLGFKEEDIPKAAEIASKAQYPNPAPLEKEKLIKLLENAYHGRRPE